MYAVPDVDDVVALAEGLGIHLGPEEAVLYRDLLLKRMDAMDAFMQARIEEPAPPMASPARLPAFKPGAGEDPLNVWLWKCHIEGDTDPAGLLAGKTVSFKDHIAVAGVPMSLGTFALDGFVPDFDATVVTRVLEAGGTVIGKNVMNGLGGGLGAGGAYGDYGRPLNPHNHEHVTGGSSSGSGAAVAGGEVDISFGGDQGGSIRMPAAYCGTVGLKPTFGLISHFGMGFGSDQSLDYTGPLTRTVEDAARALQATAGYDGYDPRQGRDVPESMDALTGLKDGVAGLRIGVVEEGFDQAQPEVKDMVLAAVDKLASLGATVKKLSIPEHHATRAAWGAMAPEGHLAIFNTGFFGMFARTYYPSSFIVAINEFWNNHLDVLTPATQLSLMTGVLARRNYKGRAYAKAQNVRPTYIKAYNTALAEVDVLVMPTCLTTAPKSQRREGRMAILEDAFSMYGPLATRNTQPFNYTGHPALAVPVGKSSEGLPASMQLIGKFFDEPMLLRTAYAYEQSV